MTNFTGHKDLNEIPILTRKKDFSEIKKTASLVLDIDILANDIYNLVSKNRTNEFYTKIIKK